MYNKTIEKEKNHLKNTATLLTTGACAALLALTALWGTVPAHAAPTVRTNEHNIKRNTSIAMQNRARLMQNRRRLMQNRRMIMQNRRMIKSHQSGSMMHHNMMPRKTM